MINDRHSKKASTQSYGLKTIASSCITRKTKTKILYVLKSNLHKFCITVYFVKFLNFTRCIMFKTSLYLIYIVKVKMYTYLSYMGNSISITQV